MWGREAHLKKLIVVAAAAVLSACWILSPPETYTVAVIEASGGTISLSPPPGQIEEGTTITATATPDSGYYFTGWGQGLSGSENPRTFVVQSDMTISALFQVTPVTFASARVETDLYGFRYLYATFRNNVTSTVVAFNVYAEILDVYGDVVPGLGSDCFLGLSDSVSIAPGGTSSELCWSLVWHSAAKSVGRRGVYRVAYLGGSEWSDPTFDE